MGLKLVDLLRWSKEVTLKKPDGSVLEKDGKPVTVWLRIIGDQDLDNSYKAARASSARLRATLRDKDSEEYLATLSIIGDATAEQCKDIIVSSQRREFNGMSYANVERPDLPRLDEIAIDADAPTLEEQERFDQVSEKINGDYLKALDDYVTQKETELSSELDALSIEEIRARTIEALIDVQALENFIKELDVQKAYRASYIDKYFKEPAFDTLDEFRQFRLNAQLIAEYSLLELSPDDIKN